LARICALDNATAKIFKKHSIDIVLLGAGISIKANLLYEFFAKEIQMLSVHYVGSGLLMSEICTALDDFIKEGVTINNTSFFFTYLFFLVIIISN
jgi:hypothetical protein